MAEAGRGKTRRDSKRRVLRPGESVRADGKYQYKYHIEGKPYFVYSWKLEPTDKLPKGKKPCLSLRELEKQINTELAVLSNIVDGQMTVCELVDRYLKTKTGVRESTKQGYVTVQRLLAKEKFGSDRSCLYINMNNFYFSQCSLVTFAGEFVKKGGKVLLIDQMFKYPNWSNDLRTLS